MPTGRTVVRALAVLTAGWIVIASAAAMRLYAAPTQQSPSPAPAPSQRTVIDKYCVTCHNQKLKTAGLLLDTADMANPSQDGALWEKVIRKLRTGAMPPPGAPRPDQAAYDTAATYLET